MSDKMKLGASLDQPIILVGRGGSGTRLLSQIAMDAEIFLGTDINPTNDSMEWRDLIYEIAIEKVENKTPSEKLHSSDTRQKLRAQAEAILQRNPKQVIDKWGWKLPETIFILPEVLNAFPEAKIVHIVRHPATCCLRNRHVTSNRSHKVGAAVLEAAYAELDINAKSLTYDRQVIDNAVSWIYQVGAIERLSRNSSLDGRLLTIRYEDIFDDWDSLSLDLATFIDIDPKRLTRPELDSSRRQAFTTLNPCIAPVWFLTENISQKFGYAIDDSGAPVSRPWCR